MVESSEEKIRKYEQQEEITKKLFEQYCAAQEISEKQRIIAQLGSHVENAKEEMPTYFDYVIKGLGMGEKANDAGEAFALLLARLLAFLFAIPEATKTAYTQMREEQQLREELEALGRSSDNLPKALKETIKTESTKIEEEIRRQAEMDQVSNLKNDQSEDIVKQQAAVIFSAEGKEATGQGGKKEDAPTPQPASEVEQSTSSKPSKR